MAIMLVQVHMHIILSGLYYRSYTDILAIQNISMQISDEIS